jgi:hypothetical protein
VTLAETQELFHRAITGQIPLDEAPLGRCFGGTGELSAGDRVAIYRNMYTARLIDALRETFPNLARFLGEERFAALGGAYLAEHPSEHHDVGRLGRRLADFLKAYPDPGRADLADLAELEWTRNEVFFAPESAVVGADALAAAGVESVAGVRLRMAPCLGLLVLAHDAAALWRSLETGEDVLPPCDGSPVAVWRRDFEVFHCTLPPEEAEALRAAMEGEPLGAVCAAFAGCPDPAAEAHAAISSWFAEGWVAGVASPAP